MFQPADVPIVTPQRPTHDAVVFVGNAADAASHRSLTTRALAAKMAEFLSVPFAGDSDGLNEHRCPFIVPIHTLVGGLEASRLGILGEADLFGGIVPAPFIATKSITHPLISPDAFAPAGWSTGFGDDVRDVTLEGSAAFTRADAEAAGRKLLELGDLRIKLAWADGGHDQFLASNMSQLTDALSNLDEARMAECGLVIERNLEEATTYSVGRIRLGNYLISYCGTQTTTRDNEGQAAYGGSSLYVVKGELVELLAAPLDDDCRQAVRFARIYDEAALKHFPGLIASRRNYDVIAGAQVDGSRRFGVLEQSWRLGGASGAEVAAFEAFLADPALVAVKARCVEAYGADFQPPADAWVYFHGNDPKMGPMTKYAQIEERIHAF